MLAGASDTTKIRSVFAPTALTDWKRNLDLNTNSLDADRCLVLTQTENFLLNFKWWYLFPMKATSDNFIGICEIFVSAFRVPVSGPLETFEFRIGRRNGNGCLWSIIFIFLSLTIQSWNLNRRDCASQIGFFLGGKQR